MKQSRVHISNWWHFLRKLLEPSRTVFFLFSQLVFQSSPFAFWSTRWDTNSGAVLKCTAPKETHLCDRRCYTISTIESKGKSPWTSTFISSFLLCILLLFTTSLLEEKLQKEIFLRTRYIFSWCLPHANLAQQCTVIKSCLGFVLDFFLFVFLSCEIVSSRILSCMKSSCNHFCVFLADFCRIKLIFWNINFSSIISLCKVGLTASEH